tara:strand:- start:365 stop:793 length:429 start_codon:yes stop_codon:yes gene_type:complete
MSYNDITISGSNSGFDVQGPAGLPGKAFGSANLPVSLSIQPNVSSQVVIVPGLQTPHATIDLHFAVATASAGTLAINQPLTGERVLSDDNAFTYRISYPDGLQVSQSLQPITLPFTANVWSASGAEGGVDAGTVTFIYRGGL